MYPHISMTIMFDKNKIIIVYALEKVIFYTRDYQYIFLAQSLWWISSVLVFQQGLCIYIDKLKTNQNTGTSKIQNIEVNDIAELRVLDSHIHQENIESIQGTGSDYSNSGTDSTSITEDDIHNEII